MFSSKLKNSINDRVLSMGNVIQLHYDELNALSILYKKRILVESMGFKYSTYQKAWTIETIKRARSYLVSIGQEDYKN